MFVKLFENLSGRQRAHGKRMIEGRLSARPEFRAMIERATTEPASNCRTGLVVFLAGRVAQVLDDVSNLREAGYEVQIGIEGCHSGAVFVVDPGSFASSDALGRMLTLIRNEASSTRVIVRTTAVTRKACRLTADIHGIMRSPDGTMQDIADILGGDVFFVDLSRAAAVESISAPVRVVS